MKVFYFLLLIPMIAFSEGKPEPIDGLFKDLPVEERITKRMELAREILSGKEKKYDIKQATVLYALNVKDKPDHGSSWQGWINRILASGSLGPFSYTPEVLARVHPMMRVAMTKAPAHPGLQIVNLKLSFIKGEESWKVKEALEKLKINTDPLEFSDLFTMAQLASAIKEPLLASDLFKLMEAKASTNDDLLLVYQGRGQNAILAENWNDCADAFKKSEELFPQMIPLKVLIVRCLTMGKRFDEALSYEGKFGDNQEGNCYISEALIGKSNSLINAGNTDGAEALLTKSMKCPRWGAYDGLAKINLKKNDYERGLENIFKSLDLYGQDKATYLRGWSSSFKPSITHFKQVVLKSIELDSVPETKIQSYYELVKEMVMVKDESAKEISQAAIAAGDLLLAQNVANYDFLKYYGGLYGISGINLGNATDVPKARMVFTKCRQLKPSGDDFVNAWVAKVGELEDEN